MKSITTNEKIKKAIEDIQNEISKITPEEIQNEQIKTMKKEEAKNEIKQQKLLMKKGEEMIQWIELIIAQLNNIQQHEMKYQNELQSHVNSLIDKEIEELKLSYQQKLKELEDQKVEMQSYSTPVQFEIKSEIQLEKSSQTKLDKKIEIKEQSDEIM